MMNVSTLTACLEVVFFLGVPCPLSAAWPNRRGAEGVRHELHD